MSVDPFELRYYQNDAGHALERDLLEHGLNRLLVKMPTSTGKTVLFAALLRKFPKLLGWMDSFPEQRRGGHAGARMLVIAHRHELIEQARDKIEAQNPGLMVSIEK